MGREYVLHYFDVPGRAEPIRLAFVLCGVKFEDKRYLRDEYMAKKASGELSFLPFGQVPIRDGGKTQYLGESSAILAYVIAEHGGEAHMTRSDALEAARVEEVRSAAEALASKVSATMFMQDEAARAAARAELVSGTIPKIAAALEEHLQPSGYVSGSTLTAADLMISQLAAKLSSDKLEGIPPTIMEPYARIAACAANVNTHPWVQDYYLKSHK